jgi:NADPH2:quinone reductase
MENKRVIITRTGGSDVLQVVRENIPEPKPGEVRVKVLAAGIARADTMMRRGQYPDSMPPFPYTPGYDIVGVIDRLGEGVPKFNPGVFVAALTKVGGYSEYVCVSQDDLVPVPEKLDPAEVVSLILNGLTAYQMLHRFARVKTGEQVLFHAAGSGVGIILLQLGKLLDLKMYGTENKRKHKLISSLGGTPIDYQKEDFVKRIRSLTAAGVDAVFDPVGGSHLWKSFMTLRRTGRLIAYGEMAITGSQKPKTSEVFFHHYLPRLLNLIPGGRIVRWWEVFPENRIHPDWYHQDLAMLFNLLSQGKIKPIIAERIPMVEAARAHELFESSTTIGKIVLVCN